MASSSAGDSLAALLKNTSLDESDPEQVLKAANERLKQTKTDTQTQHVRLVALLKLDRYDDALRAVEDGGDALKAQAPLEWAYALYKQGQLEKAQEVIAWQKRKDRATMHLRAQVAYRLEDFALAAELYAELARRPESDGEQGDLRVNSGAVDAQLAWAGRGHLAKKVKHDRADQEQYETCFNAASRCVARGELKQALILLGVARDLLKASDLHDNEKTSELLSIAVQRIYVLCRLGNLEEAEKLCSELDLDNISESDTRHIAQANKLACSSTSSNPYLSHRLFEATSSIPKNDLPFKFQAAPLRRNQLTLDLQAGKHGAVSNAAPSVDQDDNAITEGASYGVYNAAAQARNQTGKAALKEIVPLLEKRPHDLGLLLTIVQLYMLTNNVGTATSLVESFITRLESSENTHNQDARFSPGLVAVLVSLYTRQSRTTQTKTELAKAATYWRHKSKSSDTSSTLLKAAGATLLESGSAEDRQSASDLFENASKTDADDMICIAGLVASQAPKSTSTLVGKLPPISQLISGVNADQLEDAGILALERPTPKMTGKRSGTTQQAQQTKSKKIKRSRLPKDYDPNKKPDPERWLPMRDRSYYRPKGKKKARGAGGMATQGGIEEVRPGTPNQQQQSQQHKAGGGNQKSKKKKGKAGK